MTGSLAERARELEVLYGLIDGAAGGTGAAALIEGEAGIGKTALLAAAADHADAEGMSVLSARAGDLERDFAWGVVRQLFDGAVARAPEPERARLFEGAASLALPALGIAEGEESADPSHATLHGLYWLTANIAAERPLLLAIDDAHWADSPSLRFVAHLLPRMAGLPVAVLVATRPPGPESAPGADLLARIAADPAITALRPAALSQSATTALVRERLCERASDEVCQACQAVTAGNPFLLRALIEELAAADELSADRIRGLTPAAVSASVLARLGQLPPGAAALARAVAVVGVVAPLRIASRLAGLGFDEAAEQAGLLIRAGILTGDDELAFVHPLVRSAVYGDLAGPERSRWHHRAARLLAEENAAAERIASQLVLSSPAGEQWTVDQLARAAAEARSRGAAEVAVEYVRRALAEPPDDESRAELLFELGQIRLVQDPGLAISELTEALDGVRDPTRRAEVGLALGEGLTVVGRLADAIPVLSAALSELGDGGPEGLRAALEGARLGAARWEPSAQEERRQIVEAIRARAAAGQELDPRLHGQLAVEAAAEGTDRDAAVHHARAALTASERPTGAAASTLPEAMLVLAFADLADEAQANLEQWLARARAQAWPLATMLGATVATLAAVYRGSISDAVANAWEGAAPGWEIRLGPVTVAFLVEALIERGELEAARSELVARGFDGELAPVWATTPLLLARGRLHAASGDHEAAARDLLASGERAEAWRVHNPAMHPWRSAAAVSLAALGDGDRAVSLAAEEVERARSWGAPRAIGVALRAEGIARGGEPGLELLREAVAVLESSTAPLEHARALADLGSALRRAGLRSEAREHLRSALDLAHGLGGVSVAQRAREELSIAGARPRREALRGRDALTPSELRVAQLAATGRTNREIAEALFVTKRTVEIHLTASYGKLGISSRQELAGALAPPASREA